MIFHQATHTGGDDNISGRQMTTTAAAQLRNTMPSYTITGKPVNRVILLISIIPPNEAIAR